MITISIKNYKSAHECFRSDDWDFNSYNDIYKILYSYDEILLGEHIGLEYTNFHIPTDTIILLANIPFFVEYSSADLITLDSIIDQTNRLLKTNISSYEELDNIMSKTLRIQDYNEIYYDTITDYENYELIIFEQDINLDGYDISYNVSYNSGFRHCPFLIVKSV
jgi:hypothetical protein